ncbi:MAG: phosphate acyltransferase PlsX [Lachnospiraceae bacterium]|nr:phosphate acyltransferase PlsX [Lachnospiraceae bacterium]
MIKVAIDAMGGDNAPEEVVKGVVSAVKKSQDVQVFLVGRQDVVEPMLKASEFDTNKITVINAAEVIEASDHPVQAIRTKKDSSMAVGMKMVHNGEADAFISAGNSGALMVGAQVLVGREKGIDRAPFVCVLPHAKGTSLLLDAGANVDVRPEHIVTFAKLGTEYLEQSTGKKQPTVGLINIGTEETKGNELTKSAYELLKADGDINFIGNVEPTGLTAGAADILVCDGFTGNTIIKMYEGLGKLMLGTVKKSFKKSLMTKIGALLVKDSLKSELKPFDSHEYGGAPILGLKGLVMKTHGNAKEQEFTNTILQCVEYLNNRRDI